MMRLLIVTPVGGQNAFEKSLAKQRFGSNIRDPVWGHAIQDALAVHCREDHHGHVP